MAKLSSDGTYVIVEAGDCLTQIAVDYCGGYSKYKDLAKLNGLKNPNMIVIGQKIKLTGKAESSSSSTSSGGKKGMITMFGLLPPLTSRTLYACWTNPKKADQTDHFEYRWEYTRKETGNKHWLGAESETKEPECTFDIPTGAEIVYFKVKPVSKSKGDDDDSVHWTCDWTNINGEGAYAPFNVSDSVPPNKPEAPKIELDEFNKYKLLVYHDSLDPEALGGTKVEFQIIKDNKSQYGSLSSKYTINETSHYVSYQVDLVAGAEYKARCRVYNGNLPSEWSTYSNSETAPPSKPEGFTRCDSVESRQTGTISVYLEWNKVSAASRYEIQYTANKEDFNYGVQLDSESVSGDLSAHRIDSLEPGSAYYFRLRAISTGDSGEVASEWSDPSEAIVGRAPSAPTTWSSSTSAAVDGPLNLYWVHNAVDGSSQTFAELSLEIFTASKIPGGGTEYVKQPWPEVGGTKYHKEENSEETVRVVTIKNTTDFEERDKTSRFDAAEYLVTTVPALYADGLRLRWMVRTMGVQDEYSPWSTPRIVDIYAPPTAAITLKDGTNEVVLDTVTAFPLNLSVQTSPDTQSPIGFFVSISSRDTYDTVDHAGNDKTVSVNEEVYSRHFDQNGDLQDVVLNASDVDLEANVTYVLTCVASMDSGLSAETSLEFTVNWTDVAYTPNASITYDSSKIITQIRPYCELYEKTFKKASYDAKSDTYASTDEVVSVVEGAPLVRMFTKNGYEAFSELNENGDEVYYYFNRLGARITTTASQIERRENVFTAEGDQVYRGYSAIEIDTAGNVTGGEDIDYYEFVTGTLVPGVTLSVYRREFDGSYTELGTNIDNTKNTHIIDPHPALDYARYRIVAVTNSTGAVSYYDLPSYPIGEKAVIIQWNEEWSQFDVIENDTPAQQPWSGSLLRLPYNVDVSDSYKMDVSLVEYAGRKRPVSYYGTQLGESSTWNVTIPKDDEETLYSLRRLAVWPGDAYVREPSGTGYWANVSVAFSQTHCEMTIPVTLTITRVEGGA